MSESPPSPPVAVTNQKDSENAEPTKKHGISYKRVAIELGLGAVAITIAVWPSTVAWILTDPSGALTAVATAAIAIYTRTLYASTKRIQQTSDRTLQHLEREFIAGHPPRVRLRRVTFARPDGASMNQPDRIKIEVTNVGETPGTITELALTIVKCWADRFDAHQVLTRLENNIVVKDYHIRTGHSLALYIPMDRLEPDTFTDPQLDRGTVATYCAGYICYLDSTGQTPRRMGFVRQFNPKTLAFDRIKNRDFNYAD